MKTTITTKDSEGNTMFIDIELGRTKSIYWSITASVYEKGKRIVDKNMIYCGCLHDEILKVKPELKIFVNLHLSDGDGVPMYAGENGFYFYEIMTGVAKYHTPEKGDKEKYYDVLCKHLRIEPKDLDKLICLMDGKTSEQKKIFFASFCNDLMPYWKAQSNKALEILTTLCENN